MDVQTLNDLLECSVCLERLDTSSKVLPCQHTFCRKCLEVIVSSRQELRCPECRILVDIKIEDLPPNVLLMRILEGIKNASHNQNNSLKSPRNTTNNSNSNNTGLNNVESDCSKIIINEQPVRASNEQNTNRRIVPHAFALYDFLSKESGDLNFKKGDVILLRRKLDPNWFVGEINGREGSFPINYVQIIVPLPVPQCIALYDFKMGPNEEEGCLTFKKGTIINVLRRVDHNWAEGRIGSCIGIFPIAFVEMNGLAKQLLESGGVPPFMVPRCLPPIPAENNSSDSSTITTSPNSTCSSNTSTNSAPSSPTSNLTSPQHNSAVKHRDVKDKRHSLNAITGNSGLSIVQSNRHSAEILSVPNESVDPANTVSLSNSSNTPSATTGTSRIQEIHQHHQAPQQTARANVLKTNGNQNVPNLPWAYVALYPYKPRKSDELELKKGCVYFVTERCLDGWYKGKNWADKSGVFPGNYVTPLRNRDQQQIIHQRKVAHTSGQSQIITSPPPTAVHHHDYVNTSVQPMPPPELPPRSNIMPSGGSVWTKPLGQHVEAFFSRKPSNAQQRNESTNQPQKNTITNSNKDSSSHHQQQPQQQHPHISPAAANVKEKEKKESTSSSAVSLMKRLTNIKRSKSPPHTNQPVYSMDNPVFEDTTTTAPSSSKHNVSMSHPVHVRSGSCPSQLLQSLPMEITGLASTSTAGDPHAAFGSQRVKGHKERTSLQGIRQKPEDNRVRNTTVSSSILNNAVNFISTPGGGSKQQSHHHQATNSSVTHPSSSGNPTHIHRKSQSLDANTISSQITGNSPGGSKSHGNHSRESRFRCIVSYPPNTDFELELNVGDIVFVHRKQKNGWYKGTHARTNKTGLFPASFVEPDI